MLKNNLLKRIILISKIGMIFFFSTISINAQRVEKFSNLEGFNQNTVNTITQDQYGFLWIGTPNGLIKYDGYDFESVKIDFNSYINKIHADNKNRLWLATEDGVVVKVLSLEKEFHVPFQNMVKSPHVISDEKGNVWISGDNKLFVCRLIDEYNGVFELSDNLLQNHPEIKKIHEFTFYKKNKIVLATNNGLVELKLNNINDINKVEVSTVVTFNRFTKTTKSVKVIKENLWVGTSKSIFKVNIDNEELTILKNLVKDSSFLNKNYDYLSIKCIYEDNSNNVWFGTKANGLFKYITESDSVEIITYSYGNNTQGVSSAIINTIYEDYYGVIWIGTAQGGLNKLYVDQKKFYSYQNNPLDDKSLSGNLTTSLLEDTRGYLWVSTYDGALSRSLTKVNDTTIGQLEFENLRGRLAIPIRETIKSIYEDNRGNIWFCTGHSIVFYNPKEDSYKTIDLVIKDKTLDLGLCFTICQLDDNSMMFGGDVLAVIENPWGKIINQNKSRLGVSSSLVLENNLALSVLKDKTNRIWLGTENGLLLLKYNEKNLIIKKSYDRHFFNKVFSLKEDDDGNIWEGTFGKGLNKISFDENNDIVNSESYNKHNVLNDDAIYGILEDDENNFWLSTDMGICKFNIHSKKVNFFDVRDGLINNNFRQSSSFNGNSGYFYFGGLNGLTIFKPSEIKLNGIGPKIVLTGLKVKNKIVEIDTEKQNDNSFLSRSISETKEITIHEGDQIIALDIVVQHSTIPAKNKLAYKLLGFNDNWVEENTGKTTITYTNLESGIYELEVKGGNGDGIWNESTKVIKINVLPFWYKTWWSFLLLVILIMASIYGVFVYFIRVEKLKQSLKYEQLDKERADEVNQNKFRFFTNISHEFRTPLSLISGPLDKIIEQNKDENNSKYLTIIHSNTKRLLSLVDQLITFRQVEQGFVQLNLTKTTLGSFMSSINEAFEDYAVQNDINFFYKVKLSNEEIIVDVEKLERILFNLLSNSFKNTSANDSIIIEANIDLIDNKKVIYIDVVDTGVGIPKGDLENVFERFYQLGDKGNNISGGGIGLAFCKSLVQSLGGKVSVKSEAGIETRFSIILPSKNKEDYEADEIKNSGTSFIKHWVPLTETNKLIRINNKDNKRKQNLLIVEDHEDIRDFLLVSLSDKYNIELAIDGVEGLKKVKENIPDLIISDVMMDKMDGFQFCEKIKNNSATCHIPVILLTALGELEDTITGLESGADEYINKPFSIKELELRINKLIQNNLKRINHFAESTSLPDENVVELPVRDKKFLKDILNVIEENIADSSFGVEELATSVGLSTSQFYRRLKQLTGQVPNVYLRNFRLHRAAELLKSNNGYNVAEVMYQIGIESNSYFSTSFKKLYGVSPSVYLKKHL